MQQSRTAAPIPDSSFYSAALFPSRTLPNYSHQDGLAYVIDSRFRLDCIAKHSLQVGLDLTLGQLPQD